MLNYTATHQYLDYDNIEICDYCGCEFRIISYKQDGHNETEEYYCPECKKTFKIRACNTPDITLLKKEQTEKLIVIMIIMK